MAELIKREGNSVEFKVTVPKAEVNNAYGQVLKALSTQVKVPGFRPGKAPKSVLVKRVGEAYITGEVRDHLLQNHYGRAVRELNLALVDAEIHPETLQEGQDFVFSVKGETYPEVKLPEWKNYTLEAGAPEITDEVVEKTLTDLRERNATFETVERAAEASDMLTIEEQGEGEEQASTYPVYLESAQEYVRDALLGKSAGDVVNIEVPGHTHTHEDGEEHTVEAQTVTVKIVDIKKKSLPELDDEFAKNLNFDSLEALRSAVKGELERRAEQEGFAARREELVNKLVENLEAEVPRSLIERRRESMLEEIKGDLGRQGVKFDEYETFMREQGKYDEFLADLEKNATQRVKRDLALEKLAEELKVTLSESEWNAQLQALAQGNRLSVQDLRAQLGANGLEGFRASVLREKALAQAVNMLAPQAPAAEEAPAATEEAEQTPAADAEQAE
ncbi:trigger factor [Deinobacterium chartae]|uniref:Trigger factor n=1 Tax=Deinobacterium chartae TaxID=521158 RepID=A0A841I2U9_9DEIO|nr:trigger factor [Deinobacterium chartae]MBB6099386.1 trigger factor [Deinobacterium chartae]